MAKWGYLALGLMLMAMLSFNSKSAIGVSLFGPFFMFLAIVCGLVCFIKYVTT